MRLIRRNESNQTLYSLNNSLIVENAKLKQQLVELEKTNTTRPFLGFMPMK